MDFLDCLVMDARFSFRQSREDQRRAILDALLELRLVDDLENVAQMAMLRPYQKIIGMGWDAVPLILEELQREPDQWFWALEAITGENPVAPEAAGKVQRMAQAWIEWGKQHGYIVQ